ncbi:MAG: hypothetical protein FRX48_09849 [Lasallia pustulata]|uniref:Uncharacterized protein n=1 Tax=Lasallia pustulata TaxID=136370 RepID=A0A5M8PAV5_9LECA|nr:MAG: hypothetical protein FRX48_09849 [Lasallia pustulata]
MFRKLRFHRSHSDDRPPETSPSSSLPDRYPSTSSTSSRYRKGSSTSDILQAPARRTSELSRNPSSRDLSRSPDRRNETLGLQVIYQPASAAPLDIVFVHGLGGDSRKSWSKNHDHNLFWPQLWLPLEPDIDQARIFSFGYNANYAGAAKSISNIADFAKELLFEMKFGKDEEGQDFGMGKVPIIFIVHSMGGLVVKKAYLLGQIDENYQGIVKAISAIMFLGTPHRGTNLAELLNKVLFVSFQSSKSFIDDLNRSSPALEELNEQFRHVAPRLSIVSFYETLATTVGPRKLMVLEKESSILGYPGEISRSLNANHHDLCKYSSPHDSNYVSVRNTIRSLVGRFHSKGTEVWTNQHSEELKEVEKLFAICEAPENDFSFFRRRWMPGTCDWLLSEPDIKLCLDETTSDSRIAWLSAPPASGKSILSTHIINHLRESGRTCQYFFFKFSDQTKRSLNVLLRSIGYQMARDIPAFRRKLIDLSGESLQLEKGDSSLIWQRIFESILFKMELHDPLYWVIDGLDESESPKAFLDLLHGVSQSRTRIRVLIFSRNTESLYHGFKRLSGSVQVNFIEKDGRDSNTSDISMFVKEEMEHTRGSDKLKHQIMQSILGRAQGNFLWVRLVLDEISSCHTEQDIRDTLEDIPDGMSPLYQRMEQAIANSPKKTDRTLAKIILQWTICAHRPLTLTELAHALSPEYSEFPDLRRTIQDVCRQFVIVDDTHNVVMVHETARDYLTKTPNLQISINTKGSHAQLFARTITCILDQNSDRSSREVSVCFKAQIPLSSTLPYRGHIICVMPPIQMGYWIYCQLEVLVKAANGLTSFAGLRRKGNALRNPMLHRLRDLELLDMWAVDLVKVVGKFHRQLHSDPTAIYKLVPPFCPEKSILHRQFYKPESSDLLISGISNITWNDNLARISLRNGDQAWRIVCAAHHFAVLSSRGAITLWKSINFEEVCTLLHGEPVTAMCFNGKSDKFVSYGLKSTKLWSVPSGQVLSSTSNPEFVKAMTISFADDDTKILTGSDDRMMRYIQIEDFNSGWQVVDESLLRETSQIQGTFLNSPMQMAFNSDATLVGVCYRGFPLSVWAINESRLVGRCKRAKDFRSDHARPSTSWFAVDRFTWNPVTGHVIGCYRDGCIFKWHPVTDENHEKTETADEIAASPNGKLFITSNSDGTVKVWNFAYFSVVYQLSSGDLVTGLAFSPDCKRFYDLRGSSVNAWEPNSLIRSSETEETFSDTASEDQSPTSVSQASEAWVAQFEPVSALAAAPGSSLYCVGNEEGVVELFDITKGKLLELARFLNFLSVSKMTWAEDRQHIVAADLGGDILVKRLIGSAVGAGEGNVEAQTVLAPKTNLEGDGIHEVLLDRKSTLLLVVSQTRAEVWSLSTGIKHASRKLENDAVRRWLNHPTQSNLLLGCGPSDLRILHWDDLTDMGHLQFREERARLKDQINFDVTEYREPPLDQLSISPKNDLGATSTVTKVVSTQGRIHFLVHIWKVRPKGPPRNGYSSFRPPHSKP